jgi:hypothetical protein
MTDALLMTTAPPAHVLVATITFKVMHCRCWLSQKVVILMSSGLTEYLVLGTKPAFMPYSQALRSSVWVIAVALSSCSLLKLHAACEMMGMSLKEFFVFNSIIVFQRTGPGMKNGWTFKNQQGRLLLVLGCWQLHWLNPILRGRELMGQWVEIPESRV